MRRIINFRASLFIAVGLVLGIFSFYEFLFGNFWFGLISLVVIFALGVLLFFLKSQMWRGIVVMLLSLILGFGISQLSYGVLNSNEVLQQNVTLVGKVCDLNRNGADGVQYYLENCVDSDGVEYRGKIAVVIFNDEVTVGDTVTISGELNSVYPVKNAVETYYLRNSIRYKLDSASLISHNSGKLKLDETIRKYVYDVAVKYSPRNGDIVYALLTGDRSALDPVKNDSFKLAGIIHLLAVSGLHVGFIVAVFCFILKRFKLHPLIELVILLVPLGLYAYICQFSPSIVRAIIMLICSYAARSVFGKYDLLTSLSWAVAILLLVNPFNLFDVGFQLSAMSVFGIATVYGTLNRSLAKRNIPRFVKYIVNSLSISLACSVSTFFILQLNYGYAPALGVVLNLIVIPLVSIAFVLCWIGLIPWVFHYVLWVVDWVLEFVVLIAKWVANLSFGTVYIPAIALTVVVVALWLFELGGYINLKRVGRIITNSVMPAIIALCIGLSFVKLPAESKAFVSYGYNGAMCVVTSSDGEAAMIGGFSNVRAYNDAVDFVKKYKIKSCTLYFTDFASADKAIVDDALSKLPVSIAYKLDFSYNGEVQNVFAYYQVSIYQQMENTSHGDSITVTSIFDGGLRAVLMRTDDFVITQLFGSEYAVASYLQFGIYSDIYVLPSKNKTYSDHNYLTLSPYQSQSDYNYGANKYGNFTITQKGDTIKIKFR